VAEAYSTATSAQGAKFLEKVIEDLPFSVKSIQVDGGSEFMKDFEKKCEELKIPLFVLPPKKPNGMGGLSGEIEPSERTFMTQNSLSLETSKKCGNSSKKLCTNTTHTDPTKISVVLHHGSMLKITQRTQICLICYERVQYSPKSLRVSWVFAIIQS
jgi:hypothetical protein